MIYMKFLNPIVAPLLYPIFNKVVTYFWGPEALQTDAACPIRPKAKKSGETSSSAVAGDSSGAGPSGSSTLKAKDD